MSTASTLPAVSVPHTRAAPSQLFLVLWALFPVLVPFYLFGRTPVSPAGSLGMVKHGPVKVEGGVPQPADFLMAGVMGLVFFGIGFRFHLRLLTVIKALGWFVAYTVLVNVTWSLMVDDPELSLLKSSLFYFYDFMLFCSFLVLHWQFQDRLLRVTVYAVAASVFLQALLSPLAMERSQFRQALFFNNFNQLGYYAVLSATLFFVGSRYFRVSAALQICFYVAVAYLAILSLSKAAIFAFALLVLLAFVSRPGILLVGTATLGGILLLDIDDLAAKLEQRLTAQEADDSLAKRGYDRIVHHAPYLVFGAGEGANYRFVSEHAGEMHSSFGSLLFSYGIIGLALFAFMLFAVFRRGNFKDLLFLLPPFLYGLAHQGLRFTLFWVLLAFLCCLGKRTPNIV